VNLVFAGLVVAAVVFAAFTGSMDAVGKAAMSSAGTAVTLSIGLVGVMALWLGIMRVAEEAGLLALLSKLVRPLMVRLFPEVPGDHPAMASMVMNIAANMLGLGNAATPLGLKAMQDLQTLNQRKETATNAMALFLAINTSSVQLVPATVIAMRASAGASQPADIVLPTLLATMVSTTVAIVLAKMLSRLPRYRPPPLEEPGDG